MITTQERAYLEALAEIILGVKNKEPRSDLEKKHLSKVKELISSAFLDLMI
jgi:hypothetical protein